MKKFMHVLTIFSFLLLFGTHNLFAQNPIFMKQFTADPSARVFEGKVYVYPSHDIPCGDGEGMIGFCMADYHVFSSENLTDWEDHGVIVSQNKVEWVDSTSFSMWAPDCIYKNGKYYFYFPAIAKDGSVEKGMAIGVAISDTPYGPFKPELKPIKGVSGIDPNPFIDKDGEAYLYWASKHELVVAKLKSNMKELASEPQVVAELPDGFKEGPYLFERNDIYYFTFPHVANNTERLDYAIGNNPMGPFEHKGIIMDESPIDCWTNHHSILEYKKQWYLFYHHNDLSPDFDKNRSIRIDSLFFNEDGTIQKVIPTFRGVGITKVTQKIEIDRFSAISSDGGLIDFLDDQNKTEGWKTILDEEDAWVQYNSVDFSNLDLTSVNVKASSESGGVLEIRIDKVDGPIVAKVEITQNINWNITNSTLSEIPSGIHNLYIVLKGEKPVEIDWISFE